MTHGSLFSGIGGFDLAAEWMGWENIFHCEWNEFGQKVLHHYWPEAELFTDITKSDFTKYANKIDILTGGFPCQPYSTAGKRLGKEDARHLWPEMLRAIREIQPRWVVGENVRGLTNWNGGLVFDEVQADLEAQGYEVLPFLLPACSVNAPHRRDRIWFVAHRDNNGLHECNSNNEVNASEGGINAFCNIGEGDGKRNVTDSEHKRLEWNNKTWKENNQNWEDSELWGATSGCSQQNNNNVTDSNSISNKTRTQREVLGQPNRKKTNAHSNVERRNQWQNFPTVTPICNGDDGISDRLDSITFPKWRNESIKAGGNAIVPQVVYQIFKTIQQYDNINFNFNP